MGRVAVLPSEVKSSPDALASFSNRFPLEFLLTFKMVFQIVHVLLYIQELFHEV